MLRSLRTAALGMAAQQLNVDSIANNLANVNTTGYKKSTVEFQDLLYETIHSGSAEGAQGNEKPSEINIGLGNKPISTFRSYSQGAIEETSNPLDMAISGKGFFQVLMPDGGITYSRDGAFRINSVGEIVNSAGLKMYPNISLPDGIQSVSIAQDGVVAAIMEGETIALEIGQVELANFMNPAGLKPIGGNLLEATEASGDPNFGMAGDEGYGTIMQGYLEKSNVDVVKEMINLIVAQRSYEINSKAVKTADEMLAMTNALKR
ncbi:MAG: flagellar basal-body rod protein FlgG [Candidatus Marinimicrobia bacterium]|nr:flagellar basal-body rod protein FlgG [Candidatus Neomarinimicrobiota bacterium]